MGHFGDVLPRQSLDSVLIISARMFSTAGERRCN